MFVGGENSFFLNFYRHPPTTHRFFFLSLGLATLKAVWNNFIGDRQLRNAKAFKRPRKGLRKGHSVAFPKSKDTVSRWARSSRAGTRGGGKGGNVRERGVSLQLCT